MYVCMYACMYVKGSKQPLDEKSWGGSDRVNMYKKRKDKENSYMCMYVCMYNLSSLETSSSRSSFFSANFLFRTKYSLKKRPTRLGQILLLFAAICVIAVTIHRALAFLQRLTYKLLSLFSLPSCPEHFERRRLLVGTRPG